MSNPSDEHHCKVLNLNGLVGHTLSLLPVSLKGALRKVSVKAEFQGTGSNLGTPGVGMMCPVVGSHCADTELAKISVMTKIARAADLAMVVRKLRETTV